MSASQGLVGGADLVDLSRIRIALLDDDAAARDAVVELLDSDPKLEVIGTADRAEDAVALVAEAHPDVALVDVRIDGGERAARDALAASPDTKVLGFSTLCERDAVLRMFRAGAIGFLHKDSTPEQIVEAVRAAAEGRAVVSPEISGDIVVELAGRLRADDLVEREALTRRELIEEVLEDPGSMEVLFQPIVQIGSRELVGFEALTRFKGDPSRPTEAWFEDAESSGLGAALEAETLHLAFAQLPDLPEGLYLSVNASPEALPLLVKQGVFEGVRLEKVVIELTEHAVVRDYGTLSRSLEGLRSGGARLAVDDAGAGYASLRHIVKIMPDIIKLDAELTRGIEGDRTLRALAAGLITFATETGMEIIAEGVETAAEREALLALGVPYAQGFYIGRPAPLPVESAAGRVADSAMVRSAVERELRSLGRGPAALEGLEKAAGA